MKDLVKEQAEINQKFEVFSKEMLQQLLTDGDTKDGFYKMLDPQYLMSQFAEKAKEGRWMDAAKFCFMLSNFQSPDAKKVDFIHRAKVYVLAEVKTHRWRGEICISKAIPMAVLSTKEAAEKQLKGYIDYMNDNIGSYLHWSEKLEKWVPTYSERKGDPKPLRIKAKSEWGDYQVQAFENYPQFKVGYLEIEIS